LLCLHPTKRINTIQSSSSNPLPQLTNNPKMPDHITYRSRRSPHGPRDSRSRSPRHHTTHSHRTRSPHRHNHKRKRSPDATTAPKELPFNSRQLTKRDFEAFKPMFALYLDIQKGKVLDELEETEVRGRWKSFLGKW